MQLISVNVGERKTVSAKSGATGIYKQPSVEPVEIGVDGLAGDVIVDVEHHGGVDQAVYLYGAPDYAWWSAELGRELTPATFGENLTVSNLESSTLAVGDRFHIGSVVLEVTSPRMPCVTLAERMDDPKFVKRFTQARRFGAYCRVIEPGHVQVGDTVEHVPYDGERISIDELADSFFARDVPAEQFRRLLSVPVAIRARNYYESKLGEA